VRLKVDSEKIELNFEPAEVGAGLWLKKKDL